MAAKISSSLTVTKAPPVSRTAAIAFRRSRGRPALIESATAWAALAGLGCTPPPRPPSRARLAWGWRDVAPRLYGVQAVGSNYLAEAWERGEDVLTKPPIAAHTVADSISAGLPRDRLKAMAAVRETGGAFVTVSDEEILAAIPALARGSGLFAEPAGAAAWAGLVRAAGVGLVGPTDRVVVISTGSGLKDVASARRAAEEAGAATIEIEADRESLERALADHGIGRGEA